MPLSTQNITNLSPKEITLKSLKEEIQLFRQNKSSSNTPLPEGIWKQLHVLLMRHPLTECVRELNLSRVQVERELVIALQKVGSTPSQFSLRPKSPEASVEPTAVFQEIQVREEATPDMSGLVSVQNQESRPVEQATSMATETPTVPAEEPSELPIVGVPETVKKTDYRAPSSHYPFKLQSG